ncbi:MAG: hypothetical protein AAF682_12415 [Planctomycetota bacterium]
MRLAPRTLLAALPLLTPLSAQTQLLAEGDVVPGLGPVDSFGFPAVNDAGGWGASVWSGSTSAIVVDGAVVLAKGTVPLGATLPYDSLNELELSADGRAFWLGAVTSPLFGGFPVAAVGVDDGLLRGVEDACLAPGLPPGTVYQDFDDIALAPNDALLVLCQLQSPGGSYREALVRLDVDAAGGVTQETLVLIEGGALAGEPDPIESCGSYDGASLNAAGSVSTIVDFGPPGNRGVYLDGALVVKTGDLAPIGTKAWSSFSRTRVNAGGTLAFRGTLLPTGTAILGGGSVVAHVGTPLAGAGGQVVETIYADPFELADDGTVLWHARFGPPFLEALCIDDEILVRVGQTFGGQTISDLKSAARSPDGRHVALIAWLDASFGEALYLIEPSTVTVLAGCSPGPASLALTGPPPAAGGSLSLALDGGQAPSVFPFLALANAPAAGAPPCGVLVPGVGELLIDLAAPNPVLVVATEQWSGAPIALSIPLPTDAYWTPVYAQGLFFDPAGLAPGEPLRLTNGLAVTPTGG